MKAAGLILAGQFSFGRDSSSIVGLITLILLQLPYLQIFFWPSLVLALCCFLPTICIQREKQQELRQRIWICCLDMLPSKDCLQVAHENQSSPYCHLIQKGNLFQHIFFPLILLLVQHVNTNIRHQHMIVFQILCIDMQLVDHYIMINIPLHVKMSR